MSKSTDSAKGVIFLTDSPEEVQAKVMAATTDSVGRINYDKDEQPGITNLLSLLALFSDKTTEAVCEEYEGQTQYGPLKVAVSEAIVRFLKGFQSDLARVDTSAIEAKLTSSEQAMNQHANATLLKVQQAVGLRK